MCGGPLTLALHINSINTGITKKEGAGAEDGDNDGMKHDLMR